MISQVIKAQAVCIFVNQFLKLRSHLHCLGFIHTAFKNRILHPLSVGSAAFGHLPESFPSSSSSGIDVIGHKEKHGITSKEKGDIRPDHDEYIAPEEEPVHRE